MLDKLIHSQGYVSLIHWGRVTHICVSKLTIIGSDNGLSPGRRQAIIWTNAGILFIRTLGTNLSEILSEIHAFSFKKMHLKMASAKWRPFCHGLNVLTGDIVGEIHCTAAQTPPSSITTIKTKLVDTAQGPQPTNLATTDKKCIYN